MCDAEMCTSFGDDETERRMDSIECGAAAPAHAHVAQREEDACSTGSAPEPGVPEPALRQTIESKMMVEVEVEVEEDWLARDIKRLEYNSAAASSSSYADAGSSYEGQTLDQDQDQARDKDHDSRGTVAETAVPSSSSSSDDERIGFFCHDMRCDAQRAKMNRSLVAVLAAETKATGYHFDDTCTPLGVAATVCGQQITAKLIGAGADHCERSTLAETPLHTAVLFKNNTVIMQLIDAGVPVDAQDYNGETALHLAARCRNSEGIAMLLERGARTDIISSRGITALADAVTYGSKECVRRLLAAGADPNGTQWVHPIVRAARRGNSSIVKMLVAAGASLDIPGRIKNVEFSPLEIAIRRNDTKTAQLLITLGADPSHQ